MVDFLSWHNSEVRCVTPPTTPGGQARVTLSAGAVERHEGDKRLKAGTAGFMKPLELVFEQARLSGKVDECLGGVTRGDLRLSSMRSQAAHQIPLPWQCQQDLTLTLEFRNGSVLVIEASAAQCQPSDDTRFLESFAC